jgi:hypothetical protein
MLKSQIDEQTPLVERGSANPAALRMMQFSAAILFVATTVALLIGRKWQLVHDSPLMHYVVFLMDHGFAPYRDIVDMNMPGSYIIERAVIHTLGEGITAWYAWDVMTGIAAVAASCWIAGAGRRYAGMTAALLAYLYHLQDGAANLGQRDWIVAVLLLIAFGCMFEMLRKQRPIWMSGFALCCGTAFTIKPVVIVIPFLFLPVICLLLRKNDRRVLPVIVWTCAGSAVPIGIVSLFLTRWGVWREFSAVLYGLVPYYAGLQRLSYLKILLNLRSLLVLAAGTAYLFWRNRSWRRWESNLLLGGVVAGAILYFAQRKGWSYHSYSLVAFLMLWAMIEINEGLREKQTLRSVAGGMLMLAVCYMPASFVWTEGHRVYSMETIDHLESDLNRLGGSQLSGKVQCLDMTLGGCINVLNRMKLVQTTGSLYDFYLFPVRDQAVTRGLKEDFLDQLKLKAPRIIVLSSQNWPGDTFGYQQIERWPAFSHLLADKYYLEYEFLERAGFVGYRIYVLK